MLKKREQTPHTATADTARYRAREVGSRYSCRSRSINRTEYTATRESTTGGGHGGGVPCVSPIRKTRDSRTTTPVQPLGLEPAHTRKSPVESTRKRLVFTWRSRSFSVGERWSCWLPGLPPVGEWGEGKASRLRGEGMLGDEGEGGSHICDSTDCIHLNAVDRALGEAGDEEPEPEPPTAVL